MKNSKKSKIVIILSAIFFLTSLAAQINNIYLNSKENKYKDKKIKVIDSLSKEEKDKVLELIKSIDEATTYLDNGNISIEIKRQLINDIITSINVINDKVNNNDDALVEELTLQYNNLMYNNDIDMSNLFQLYSKWKRITVLS